MPVSARNRTVLTLIGMILNRRTPRKIISRIVGLLSVEVPALVTLRTLPPKCSAHKPAHFPGYSSAVQRVEFNATISVPIEGRLHQLPPTVRRCTGAFSPPRPDRPVATNAVRLEAFNGAVFDLLHFAILIASWSLNLIDQIVF